MKFYNIHPECLKCNQKQAKSGLFAAVWGRRKKMVADLVEVC